MAFPLTQNSLSSMFGGMPAGTPSGITLNNPAYGVSGGFTGGSNVPPTFTPGFQLETPDMGTRMGGMTGPYTPPPGAVGLGGAISGAAGSSGIPSGMTFGQWHDTIPGLATGSPYDASSFGNTLNNIGSQATQNFNAYLGASPGMQSAGIQPLTHTAMDPSVANQVANVWSGGASSGLAGLYQSILGRAPDAAGLSFYGNNLANGSTTLQGIQADMMNSPEYLASHPAGATGTGGTTGAGIPAGGYGLGSNPYQGAQADAMRAQQQQFLDQAMNGIRSGAVAVGGLGGTRQGVAQGVAAGQAATGLDSALAGMYSNNWNQDQNRALSQYGMDQNFYNAQRGLDQSGLQLGANIYNLGQQGQWTPYQQYNNTLSPYTGFGTTTGSTSQGGGVTGAVGGALSGAALGHMAGWW